MFELTVESSFAAAHRLRDYQGKCETIHGHTWRVAMSVTAPAVNQIGIAADFHDLKTILKQVLEPLDHVCLNDIPPFTELNPSSENIARFLFGRLKALVQQHGVQLSKVTVWESPTACAAYSEQPRFNSV
ncbi:MAG: 6-carboxytetrahydropterin synthase QueD [Desulfobacterota bacterium]|nr:6-carboxytetrahydropterin synthase QueD [Thermodesulfobacteriota bacterium]